MRGLAGGASGPMTLQKGGWRQFLLLQGARAIFGRVDLVCAGPIAWRFFDLPCLKPLRSC